MHFLHKKYKEIANFTQAVIFCNYSWLVGARKKLGLPEGEGVEIKLGIESHYQQCRED